MLRGRVEHRAINGLCAASRILDAATTCALASGAIVAVGASRRARTYPHIALFGLEGVAFVPSEI